MHLRNLRKKIKENALIFEILIVLLVIFIGAVCFHLIEGYSFLDSLYFVTMTMTTIGYGDITPQTSAGKIMIVIYAFIGVPIFFSISGLILESRFNKRIKKYINRVYKEMQYAEEELEKMEKKVNQELTEVIEAEVNIKNTERKVQKTNKKVEEIQDSIEESLEASEIKKPRRKKMI